MTYVHQHNLADLSASHTQLAHVYKANTDPKVTLYKFCEEVPRSVTHALLLDKEKGLLYDESWRCVIDKETNQLREYHTFCPYHHGEGS